MAEQLDNGVSSRRSFLKGSLATVALASSGGVLLSACARDTGGGSSGPIRVGVISPLSGAWTVYGRAHSAGFQFAVDEINEAGGTLGRKWEVILADSKTEPRIVTEQANRLIRQEQVDFLAGTFSSAERNAGAPVVTDADKVLLYPTFYEGQLQKYYPGHCNPNIFMFGPEPTQQVWPHMEYMMNEFGKRFFLIGSDYVWPQVTNLFTKEKIDELGGEVVGEVYIPFNTPQYDSVLRDIRGSGANIVFHTLTGTDTVNFRKQFAAAGMNEDFILWTVDDEEAATEGVGPEASAGAYVSFDYFWSIDNPNNVKFREKFGSAHPDVLMNTVGVAMYNAAHMAARAIEDAGEVSTETLRQGLADMTFADAPQGEVRMRGEDNQLVLPSYLMKVREDWTGPDDMFEEVRSEGLVEPKTARCDDLPLSQG